MQQWIMDLALGFLRHNPTLAPVFMVLGVLRLVMKPLQSFVSAVVSATPYDSDDRWWQDAQQSKAWLALAYILDWTASIKLPGKSE